MGARSEDVGEQALMRGLDTAGPIMRLGAIPVLQRASTYVGLKATAGYSPAVDLAPAIGRMWVTVSLLAWFGGQYPT